MITAPCVPHTETTAAPEQNELRIGFIALNDCAPIVVARELGFFERYGLEVTLSREPSWSSIRDKVSVGLLDAAHMLAPMPLAATLGIDGIARPMVTALSLGLNGNAITVSTALDELMREADPTPAGDHVRSASALRRVTRSRRLTFATVFPFSAHNYQLRCWLESGGIDPDRDVDIVIAPPSQMVQLLESGRIDGFCVGEPWNSVAVQRGLGRVAITGYELRPNCPEKVLGVTEDWARNNPTTHQVLVRALIEASAWLDDPRNRPTTAAMLARAGTVGVPIESILPAMTGAFRYAARANECSMPDFHVFHRHEANVPRRSDAAWFLSQMIRWGQASHDTDPLRIADRVYQIGTYHAAAETTTLLSGPDRHLSPGPARRPLGQRTRQDSNLRPAL